MITNQSIKPPPPPQISVCIPTYEMHGVGVSYLKRSLELLAKQDFTDFEVVISDQSKDHKIKQLCRQFATQLNINYIFNAYGKRQASANLNNAMHYAKGEIIQILFQDDFMQQKDALQIILEKFSTHTAKWCIIASSIWFDDKIRIKKQVPRYHRLMYLGRNLIGMPSVISLKNENILPFDGHLIWLMDVNYYRRCYETLGSPLLIDDALIGLQLHSNQVSKNITATTKRTEITYVWKKYQAQRQFCDWFEYLTRILLTYPIYRRINKIIPEICKKLTRVALGLCSPLSFKQRLDEYRKNVKTSFVKILLFKF